MRAPRPHTPRLSLHSLHPAGKPAVFFIFIFYFFPEKHEGSSPSYTSALAAFPAPGRQACRIFLILFFISSGSGKGEIKIESGCVGFPGRGMSQIKKISSGSLHLRKR